MAAMVAALEKCYVKNMPDEITYILHADGITGYCFDSSRGEVRSRRRGIETIVEAGTEEMGRANDSLTGQTLGYGVGESGKRITEEEYKRL